MSKKIVGYADGLSAAPGETVRFMVSCDPSISHYEARIVRMVCGDSQPGAPGLKHIPVASAVDGPYRARHQPIHAGSFVHVPDTAAFAALGSMTARASVFPTRPGLPQQTIMAKFDPASRTGFELFLDDANRLCLRLGDADVVAAARPLRERSWWGVTVSFDARTGIVRFMQEELATVLTPVRHDASEVRATAPAIARTAAPFLIGASYGGGGGRPWGTSCFNGRIERPVLLAAALDARQMERLRQCDAAAEFGAEVIGDWDFSQEISSDRVIDRSANACHGQAINLPVRAVRGSSWSGTERCWRHDPSQYAAMHFLDDAIHDCGWLEDFAWEIPAGLRSGCYAAWLRAGEHEDHIPFFVRPPRGEATQRLALLVPTLSYLAYANWRLPFENPAAELLMNALPVLGAEDRTLLEHPEVGPSLYDAHNDGTSAFYASRLRPNLNMRPTHPWLEQYPADLFLVDWLEAERIEYDVITDEDLHHEGVALLARYRCVMTGTHPEYHTTPMWDGLQAYLRSGGRLMYMGGNGFVWRVGMLQDQRGVIELRRGEASSSTGANEPGEYYMSSTGEYGGLWARIGRPPQLLAGVGYVAQGFDFSSGYRRLPDSFDPRAKFIFEGIGDDEVIGEFGLLGHGAAGVEVDRVDGALGTPSHALRLATSASGHTATYRFANLGGLDDPQVRSDLAYFETWHGGAVFSVGSMAWAAALSHNGYANNVAAITRNVLRRFLQADP